MSEQLKITLQNFDILLDKMTVELIEDAWRNYMNGKGKNAPVEKPNNRRTPSRREFFIRFWGKGEWVRYPSKQAFRLQYPEIHFFCMSARTDENEAIASEANNLFCEFERIGHPIDAYRRWTSKWNPSGQYLATILNPARS